MDEHLLTHISPLIHEIADATVNWGGYADEAEDSDKRSDKRAALEQEIREVVDKYRR